MQITNTITKIIQIIIVAKPGLNVLENLRKFK